MTVMLYKASDEPNPEVYGENIAYCIVGDDEVDAALADGWVRHPNDARATPAADKAKKPGKATPAADKPDHGDE